MRTFCENLWLSPALRLAMLQRGQKANMAEEMPIQHKPLECSGNNKSEKRFLRLQLSEWIRRGKQHVNLPAILNFPEQIVQWH